MVAVNESVSFTDYVSRIRLPEFLRLSINWGKGNNNTIF